MELIMYKNKLYLINFVVGIAILSISYLSAQDCVDSDGIFGNSCATIIGDPASGGFGLSCDGDFSGFELSVEKHFAILQQKM